MADKDENYQSVDGWVGNPDLLVSLEGRKESTRFVGFHSINLTRRIFVASFISLGIMLIGTLFITQIQSSSLMVLRVYFEHQADLQKETIEYRFADETVNAETLVDLVESAPVNDGVNIALYSPELDLLAQKKATLFEAVTWLNSPLDSGVTDTSESSLSSDVIQKFRNLKFAKAEMNSVEEFHNQILSLHISGNRSLQQTTLSDDSVLGTARRLIHNDRVVGYIVMSTPLGLMDKLSNTKNKGIFTFFFLALAVALFFAAMLARSITDPLHDLARAAEIGKTADIGQADARRVLIPDMAGRKDVVGRLASAMGDMTQALYSRIETNESFAADVAHEIKNPLASMRSAVETLRFARDEGGKEKLLDILDNDVQRLDRLVSDISNASRLDAELVSEETESFDLSKMLSNIVEFHRIEAGKKGVDLFWEGPEKPVLVDGLEERIAQVFVNLVTNAMSFCEKGDAIRVWSRVRGQHILAVVEDTGPGIPEESREDIFRRFYSQRPADDFGNHSGLGLAISKQIVEAHGGTIWAENIRNGNEGLGTEVLGARFVVGLPA